MDCTLQILHKYFLTTSEFHNDISLVKKEKVYVSDDAISRRKIVCCSCTFKGYEDIIQDTIEYTKQRETFGKPIIDNQAVHFRLAELQTEVELLRALTYLAVEEYIDGKDVLTKASMVKLKSGRLGRELTDACLQYWGGMGFMWESSVARAYRDTRLGSIGGGSDEECWELFPSKWEC